MPDNPITGATPFVMDGKEYSLHFGWGAIVEISKKFGENTNLFDPGVLSSVLSIGLKKYHGNISPQDVLDASPPVIDAISAVNKALERAYFGDKGAPEDGKANPLTGKATVIPSALSSAPSSSPSVPVSSPATAPDSSGT